MSLAPFAEMLVAADDKSKVYGAALPALTARFTGFVNGDTTANLTAQPALTTTATPASPVGSFPINAAGAAAANYDVTFSPGTLSVAKALLTATADDKHRESTDKQEEIHLHGYDIAFEVPSAGGTVSHTFKADKTGDFEIEIEDSSTEVSEFDVSP